MLNSVSSSTSKMTTLSAENSHHLVAKMTSIHSAKKPVPSMENPQYRLPETLLASNSMIPASNTPSQEASLQQVSGTSQGGPSKAPALFSTEVPQHRYSETLPAQPSEGVPGLGVQDAEDISSLLENDLI